MTKYWKINTVQPTAQHVAPSKFACFQCVFSVPMLLSLEIILSINATSKARLHIDFNLNLYASENPGAPPRKSLVITVN